MHTSHHFYDSKQCPQCQPHIAAAAAQTALSQGVQWEGDVKQGEYAGTFKWSQKTDFPLLPPFVTPAPLDTWQSYLQVRMTETDAAGSEQGSGEEEASLVVQPAMLDALSFPLSLLYALRQLLTVDKDFKDMWQGGHKVGTC